MTVSVPVWVMKPEYPWHGERCFDDYEEEPTFFEKANALVNGDRQGDYGTPEDNWNRTAQVWSGIIGKEITAKQAALMMVGLKIVREAHKEKTDNMIDAAGYLILADRL